VYSVFKHLRQAGVHRHGILRIHLPVTHGQAAARRDFTGCGYEFRHRIPARGVIRMPDI
jgi:hypothetical protein